jgi:hypothetical protein
MALNSWDMPLSVVQANLGIKLYCVEYIPQLFIYIHACMGLIKQC